MTLRNVNALISKIYEAPLRLESWGEAVGAVASHFSAAAGGQFHMFDVRRRRMVFSSVPTWGSTEADRIYNEHFAATDPRRALVDGIGVGAWVFDQDHFDSRFVRRSEIYEFLRAYDIRYAAANKVCATDDAVAVFAIFRGHKHEPFDTTDKRLLNLLSPHLVQAANLATRFEQLRTELAHRDTALDAVHDAVIAVDARFNIVFHNKAAEDLFRSAAPIQSAHGTLHIHGLDNAQAVRHAVKNAIERGSASSLGLHDEHGESAGVCRVLPVADDVSIARFAHHRFALLVFTPKAARAIQVATISALFGLTAAEARVAEMLAAGATPRDISDRLGRSITTVRTQMSQIFQKTSTRRQAELIALLKSA